MTTTLSAASPDRLARRLRPLRASLLLQGVAPWVPVEKVFMTQLGFSPALVATMAAAYAAVVPVMEIPSGILADRWSRRGVLMLAAGAALLSVLVGAVSTGVTTYILSAMVLGVYFAMQSGTVDAIVYDVLLEEVGDADSFEKHYGRIQLLNSVALTGSAVVGGAIAAFASPRLTYVLTIPFAVAGLLVLLRFREPTLHREREASGVREHLAATWRTLVRQPQITPVVLAMMLGAATTQMLFEFGPLWLIAAGVATFVLGPYTAGMTAALGAGGFVAGRLHLDRPAQAGGLTAAMSAVSLVLVVGSNAWVVAAAQIALTTVLVAIGIHLSRLLHDAVPSSQRTGVASGVSTLSWLTFLPCSLLFGLLTRHGGVHAAGWIVSVLVTTAGFSLVAIARSRAVVPTLAPCISTS